MNPKTKLPKTPKEKKSPKKGSKRKRKTSESDEVSTEEPIQNEEEQSQNDDKESIQDSNIVKLEDACVKFQKYKKDKLWKLKKIPHYLLASFNILLEPLDLQDIRSFPLVKISLPHSVYVNSKFPPDIDFCYRRTTALNGYMHRLKLLKAHYATGKKKSKTVRKNEKEGIYSKPVIDFAEKSELHPDKYFARDYDFYYTGGNLSINNKSSQVVHVGGMHMNTLVLSVINVDQNIPKLHRLTSVDFNSDTKGESEIFEVQFSVSSDDYIFSRQKHCVSIQGFKNGKLNVFQNFRTKDVPFISFTQDQVNTNHITISDLVHKVRVCDIEKGVPINTLRMVPRDEIKPKNNWNMIKSLDSHVYLYAACKKVSMIDTRLPESEWSSNYCGISKENGCYNLCSLARSKFKHLFYVASNHKVYCVDRRYMGKDMDSKNGAVCCWTHQMRTFPLMMATYNCNNSEYIALQSPINSDMRICENMQSLPEDAEHSEYSENSESEPNAKKARIDLPVEPVYKSVCLPYMPTSLESIFHEARWEGKCIKPGSGIRDRVKACITGLDFFDHNPSSYLLTATSNGDIFARHMYDPDNVDVKPDSTTAADVMSAYEENIFRSVRKTPLETTDVCDLAGISKVFRCTALSDVNRGEGYDFPTKRKYMGRWQKSIASLATYKDALASDLISIWDFDLGNEKDLNIGSLNQTEAFNSKVSGWLNNTEEIAHSTMLNMTSVPMDLLNASSTVTPGVTDNSFMELMNNTSIMESPEQPTPSVVKTKTSKKKTRYIKGF